MKALSEFVIFDPHHERKVDESKQEAWAKWKKQELEQDYAAFRKTREYVLKNLHKLKGQTIPFEVLNIQSLPNLECVILDDLIILPYHEIEAHLLKLEMREEQLKEDEALKGGECPKCRGEVERGEMFGHGMFGVHIAGYKCKECGSTFDYKGLFKKFQNLSIELNEEGLIL